LLVGLALTLAAAILSNVLATDAAVVSSAYLHLFAPALVAAVGGLLATRSPYLPLALVIALIVIGTARTRPMVEPPTDARELSWWLTLREELPSDAVVAYVERADHRVLILPLAGRALPQRAAIDASGRAASGRAVTHYYRSSICSTSEGAPACESFERTHRLRELGRRTLPAIPSLPWLPLSGSTVDVVLFAVDGA
jgi:hypothetical protein